MDHTMILMQKLYKQNEKTTKDQSISAARLREPSSPEAPVDGDVVVQQDIGQASFGAVLCDDADVGNLDGTTDEFAQIGVVQLPVVNMKNIYKLQKLLPPDGEKTFSCQQISVVFCPSAGFCSPNFFHLLPDGLRQGEMFILDAFHCHRPPVTATQSRSSNH